MDTIQEFFRSIGEFFTQDGALYQTVAPYITFVIRFLLPVLAILVVVRCGKSLLRGKNQEELWGYLSLPNGTKLPLSHWENIVGRSPASDIVLNYPSVSRSHGAIIREDDGAWRVLDIGAKTGISVNGKQVEGSAPCRPGDVINMGGVDMVLIPLTLQEEQAHLRTRTRPGRDIRPALTMWFLTLLQLLLGVQLCLAAGENLHIAVLIAFVVLIGTMWIYYGVVRSLRRTGFEVEILAFFLCSLGMAMAASADPAGLYTQIAAFVLGFGIFIVLGVVLRDLNTAKRLRWAMAIFAVALLAVNLIFGDRRYGAANWISIGPLSFQPSEFVKIAFVFAGAATLDRLYTRRNLLLFIVLTGICGAALAYMGDFGTAAIFFVAFLVIAFLRSGNLATIALSIAGVAFAGLLVLQFKPYILDRFQTWGHAWEYAATGGYQATRTMSAAASGGLFGVGAGQGWLKGVFAAEEDLVFGMLCEELGLIVALAAVAALVILAVFAVKSAATGRSSFYVIASVAAVSIFIFQAMLNILGSVDILPLTGVTLPFVSKGGSSLMACWGLLAFIKATDTRQNASFAIKLSEEARRLEEEDDLWQGLDYEMYGDEPNYPPPPEGDGWEDDNP